MNAALRRSSLLLCAIAQFYFASSVVDAAAFNGTIVIMGSSTALGVGASTYALSWAGLLTDALTPKGYVVQNVSVSGTNTGDSLARFDHDVTPYKPNFVMLATSIVNESPAAAVQNYVDNTRLLIRKVESIGAIPILVPPYANNGFSADMYSSIKDIYNTLAAEGVPMLDFLDGTDDGQGHWVQGLSVDGTHPTDVGHHLLFDCIPLTLFDALLSPMPPESPHGFGSWVQNSDQVTEGDLAIQPYSGMGSWTISFWTKPSATVTDRSLLSINAGWLQLRRTGTEWHIWLGGSNLSTVALPGVPAFHHAALTYQSITGILRFYIDACLRAQVAIPTAAPVSVVSLGGDPSNVDWNAGGDYFGDVLLYRAPLAQMDIQAIRTGQTPWKSVEGWLPLTFSPDRPTLNLAASVVTAIVHGTWNLSNEEIPSKLPCVPRRLAQHAVSPQYKVAH